MQGSRRRRVRAMKSRVRGWRFICTSTSELSPRRVRIYIAIDDGLPTTIDSRNVIISVFRFTRRPTWTPCKPIRCTANTTRLNSARLKQLWRVTLRDFLLPARRHRPILDALARRAAPSWTYSDTTRSRRDSEQEDVPSQLAACWLEGDFCICQYNGGK